jgi:Rrf2 family protein
LAELALAYPRVVSVRELADNQRLSSKYLEQIMGRLRAAGIVSSVQGKGGGYELAKSPLDITVFDVFRVLEGSTAPVDCIDNPGACPFEARCPVQETWIEVTEVITSVLKNTTLFDLAERLRKKTDVAEPMYYI